VELAFFCVLVRGWVLPAIVLLLAGNATDKNKILTPFSIHDTIKENKKKGVARPSFDRQNLTTLHKIHFSRWKRGNLITILIIPPF